MNSTPLSSHSQLPIPQPGIASTAARSRSSRLAFIPATFAALAIAPLADAHHGRDFLLLEDYSVPDPLDAVLSANFEWSRDGSDDAFSFDPDFIVGLAPRLAIGASARWADEGHGGWDYSSISPFVQIQVTPPSSSWPVRVAVVAGYQFADGDDGAAAPDAPASHHHSGEEEPHRENHHEDGGDGEDHHEAEAHDHHGDPDDHGGAAHDHSGIHRHGEDFFHARLVVEADLTAQDKLVFNLITVVPDGHGLEWGYAAGWRHSFHHNLAVGLECIGDLSNDGEHEAVAAAYFSPLHQLTLKVGIGVGLSDEAPDASLRTGVVWRF